MCGRYTLQAAREVLSRRFGVELTGLELEARYNIAPSQSVLTVTVGKDGRRKALAMRWGFVPFWSPQPRTKLATINAKAETAASSALYRDAFRRRRCLIPADGFYEWQAAARGEGRKRPHWIARADHEPFAFAGLYSVWRPPEDPGAPPLLSCTILTTGARGAVAPLHSRMPVVLRAEHEDGWLDPQLRDARRIAELLEPQAETLVAQAVSERVNSPQHEGPELLEAAAAAAEVQQAAEETPAEGAR
jgi:putative SOS response-associated peptidase YedK